MDDRDVVRDVIDSIFRLPNGRPEPAIQDLAHAAARSLFENARRLAIATVIHDKWGEEFFLLPDGMWVSMAGSFAAGTEVAGYLTFLLSLQRSIQAEEPVVGIYRFQVQQHPAILAAAEMLKDRPVMDRLITAEQVIEELRRRAGNTNFAVLAEIDKRLAPGRLRRLHCSRARCLRLQSRVVPAA